MCFWVYQVYVYVFKSKQYIYQFTLLDFHIISGGFRCLPVGFSYLPGGKFATRSHPGKVFKIWHFPLWVKQTPPAYWDRVFMTSIFRKKSQTLYAVSCILNLPQILQYIQKQAFALNVLLNVVGIFMRESIFIAQKTRG